METLPPDEDETMEKNNLRSSAIILTSKKKLSIVENHKYYRKRSSSMTLKCPLNFVPKLKPIQTTICPSPINLNGNSPPKQSEIQNTSISTSSFDSQNDFNLKTIKNIYFKKIKPKKSFKILNIVEETYPASDCEDSPKNILINTYSDATKSDEEENNKFTGNKSRRNVKMMREKMTKIKNYFIINENTRDDSDFDDRFKRKRLYQYNKNGRASFIINNNRKNKNMSLNSLNPNKNRTKSFNVKQRYVPTILGFLEKKSSYSSLNSNGK